MAGLGFGIAQAIFRGGMGLYQNLLAGQIDPQNPTYKVSPYAQDSLGLARQLYNGRMAGASAEQNNIFANQANTTANAARNATSSSQALALAGANQGQTNQALNNLGIQEAQNKQAQVSNLNQANSGMTNELDKVFQDNLRKYQEDVAAKAALRNSGLQNINGAFSDATSLGMMGGMFGGGTPQGSTGMPSLAQSYGGANVYGSFPQARAMGGSLTPGMMQYPSNVYNAGFQQAPGQAPRIPTFNYITGRYE